MVNLKTQDKLNIQWARTTGYIDVMLTDDWRIGQAPGSTNRWFEASRETNPWVMTDSHGNEIDSFRLRSTSTMGCFSPNFIVMVFGPLQAITSKCTCAFEARSAITKHVGVSEYE